MTLIHRNNATSNAMFSIALGLNLIHHDVSIEFHTHQPLYITSIRNKEFHSNRTTDISVICVLNSYFLKPCRPPELVYVDFLYGMCQYTFLSSFPAKIPKRETLSLVFHCLLKLKFLFMSVGVGAFRSSFIKG